VSRYDEVRLEISEYRLLREFFNEHCGILFGPEARSVVERRLRERLAALGLQSFGEYYQLLRYDERGRAELEEAVNLVTNHETYFFREAYQLNCYQTELLPMLRASPQARDRFSVWSAGCSTGEEVYSLAILTRESGLFLDREVTIYGSDISRRCVTDARRGVYGPSAFRATPLEIRRRYFTERPDGTHVNEELRALCQFGLVNLLDVSRASMVRRFDVIFCRNVLIYFDEASRRRVIEMFYDRLVPGGFLLLGHSESLLNVSTAFELVHLREDLVYRKPLSSSRYAVLGGSAPDVFTAPTWTSAGAPLTPPPPAPLAAPTKSSGTLAASHGAAMPPARLNASLTPPGTLAVTPGRRPPRRGEPASPPGPDLRGLPGKPPLPIKLTPATPLTAISLPKQAPHANAPAAPSASLSPVPPTAPAVSAPKVAPAAGRTPQAPGKPGAGSPSGGEPGDKR
jgi:chemotaxis protein methyltransferase CheR